MWYLFGCMMVMVVLTESEKQCNGVAIFSLSKGEGREKSTILVKSLNHKSNIIRHQHWSKFLLTGASLIKTLFYSNYAIIHTV